MVETAAIALHLLNALVTVGTVSVHLKRSTRDQVSSEMSCGERTVVGFPTGTLTLSCEANATTVVPTCTGWPMMKGVMKRVMKGVVRDRVALLLFYTLVTVMDIPTSYYFQFFVS
jgi:hypothetical protein